MDKLDDVQLGKPSSPELGTPSSPEPESPDEARPYWPVVVAALIVLLLIVGGGAYYLLRSRPPEVPSVVEAENPPPSTLDAEDAAGSAPPEPQEEIAAMPRLDESDSWVRDLAQGLSASRQFAGWLLEAGVIRRATVVVDNVAEGVSPRAHLPFLTPEEAFRVRGPAGRPTIDPRSHARFDPVADAVASLDMAACARLYRRLEPLFDEAYRDLGYPGQRFADTLDRAIQRLVRAPEPNADAELTLRVITYEYADPKLEALSAAEKDFLRMGPRNVRRIRAQLRELARELEIVR